MKDVEYSNRHLNSIRQQIYASNANPKTKMAMEKLWTDFEQKNPNLLEILSKKNDDFFKNQNQKIPDLETNSRWDEIRKTLKKVGKLTPEVEKIIKFTEINNLPKLQQFSNVANTLEKKLQESDKKFFYEKFLPVAKSFNLTNPNSAFMKAFVMCDESCKLKVNNFLSSNILKKDLQQFLEKSIKTKSQQIQMNRNLDRNDR